LVGAFVGVLFVFDLERMMHFKSSASVVFCLFVVGCLFSIMGMVYASSRILVGLSSALLGSLFGAVVGVDRAHELKQIVGLLVLFRLHYVLGILGVVMVLGFMLNLNKFIMNPFQMTAEDQIDALRRANDEEKWGITEDDFARLATSVRDWPLGRYVYRSFRIRFGEGSEGVQQTFEAHVARIKNVFTEKGIRRWDNLHSGMERLRLLNGNHTHKPVVEWVVVNLDSHRTRDSVAAVRGPKSLADELLVIAWLFPDMIRAIDHDKLPGLIAAGYEVNVPEKVGGAWQEALLVRFDRDGRQVCVSASDRTCGRTGYSVPTLDDVPSFRVRTFSTR
jgi:hypothetical protein